MSNLLKRIATAAVILPVVLGVVWKGPPWALGLLVTLAAAGGLVEFGAMALPGEPRIHRAATVIIGTALAGVLYARTDLAFIWLVTAFLAAGVAFTMAPGAIEKAGPRLGAGVFGIVYLGLLAPCLALLARDVPDGRVWVALAIAVVVVNDTGAYFAGRSLGRHKLHPVVSPGKTVEGAVGGLVASTALVFAARATVAPFLSLADVAMVAIPASVLGPFGDLMESLIKRSAGVKDSGTLLPGHGGVLDRLDAVWFVAAWVYVYAGFLRG